MLIKIMLLVAALKLLDLRIFTGWTISEMDHSGGWFAFAGSLL